MALTQDAADRKGMPIFSGFVAYFPHALAAVAQLSRIGNEQHNPGKPLHWDHSKSQDETDALMRHITDMAIQKDHRDPDGVLAAVKILWRAAANLERMHIAGQDIFAFESETDDEIMPRPMVDLADPYDGFVPSGGSGHETFTINGKQYIVESETKNQPSTVCQRNR